ncbi:MAG TPA: response regulator [Thermodesulfatator atlanticus]|uniref:Response regulator n=1 Tax=Thermodesulfatator atlanticus TaxID=501497 RepID=A0A7V5NYT8_9BACT|nr:response regulator [Thermodesulfatator atlanticus]
MSQRKQDQDKRARILIAEDDHWLSSSLVEALSQEGYQVLGPARTGKEALELAEIHAPDLIVMDIRMPEMDGLEAARIINQRHFTPIVLLTAYTDPVFLERAREAKVLGYLMKPVSINELVSAIEVALNIGAQINHLEVELANLREKLETRKIIERAKGFLMDAYGMKEGEAMRFLQNEAKKRRVKIKVIAQAILEMAEKLRN